MGTRFVDKICTCVSQYVEGRVRLVAVIFLYLHDFITETLEYEIDSTAEGAAFQVRMVPYLLQGSRALLVEAAVAVHDCATQQLTKTRHSMLGKQPETQYVSSTACTSLGMANSNTSASAKSEGKKKISKRTL